MYQKKKAAAESRKEKTECESSQKLEIEARFIFYENGARSSGNQKGAMDRTRGLPTGVLCGLVWRPAMGFHSQSFRFEGGGRQIIGLNRTGKSCRLRWVNYLHPGLKRGKMTPQEERLVLELHSKWGNRWSRIARKLPGRTDNEIKNYWRTHMRKKAQEKKRAVSPSSSSSNCSSSSNITTNEGGASFYDTGGVEIVASSAEKKSINGGDPEKEDDNNTTKRDQREYSLDDIWEDINLPEVNSIEPVYDGSYGEEACKFACPLMASPPPPLSWDSLFKMDEDQESKNMFLPATPNDNQFLSGFEYGRSSSLTG